MKKTLGYALICSPLLGMIAIDIYRMGIGATFIKFCFVGLVLYVIFAGLYLLGDD